MPFFKINGDEIRITASQHEGVHINTLIGTLTNLNQQNGKKDLSIHCQNQVAISCDRIVLALGSKFIRDMFTQAGSDSSTFDLICPDFSSAAVQKVLDLLYTGSTAIGVTEKSTFLEMKQLIGTLRINFDLAELETVETELPFQGDQVQCTQMIHLENSVSCPEDSLRSSPNVQALDSTPDAEEEPSFLFNCQFCSKGFNIFLEMSEHVKDHFSDPDLSDGEESMLSYQPESLDCEQELVPDNTDVDVMQPEPFTPTQEQELVNLEVDVSNSEPKYNCCTCNLKFLNYLDRDEHITNKHLNPASNYVRIPKIILRKLEPLPKLSNNITDQEKTLDTEDFDEVTIIETEEPKRIKLDKESSKLKDASQGKGIVACKHCQKMHLVRNIDSHQEKCSRSSPSSRKRYQRFAESKCSRCNQEFSGLSSLRRHIACVHFANELNKVYGLDHTQCSICKIKFFVGFSWSQHMLFSHNAIPLNDAEQCLRIQLDKKRTISKAFNNGAVQCTIDESEQGLRIQTDKRRTLSQASDNKSTVKESGKSQPGKCRTVSQACPSKPFDKTKTLTFRRPFDKNNLPPKIDQNRENKLFAAQSYYCPACPAVSTKYLTIVSHICQLHYSGKLQVQIKNKTDCRMCCEVFEKEEQVMIHLVTKHKIFPHLIPSAEKLAKKTYKNV